MAYHSVAIIDFYLHDKFCSNQKKICGYTDRQGLTESRQTVNAVLLMERAETVARRQSSSANHSDRQSQSAAQWSHQDRDCG